MVRLYCTSNYCMYWAEESKLLGAVCSAFIQDVGGWLLLLCDWSTCVLQLYKQWDH